MHLHSPGKEHANRLPAFSSKLERIVAPLHRIFDRLYHSRYNPLYRSGTLAVGMLLVLIATGLYLIFFYSVGRPYESVRELQDQLYLGRWIRALHRYATDVMIVASAFHVLQLLVQGKTWGPRILPWISGVALLLLFFLSAWSGYVMVWDEHAQLLALSGARMLQTFGLFEELLAQAFDGSVPVNSSFFFMNLFLHVALPVGLLFGLWIHTAKISRTRWFPQRPIFITSVGSLILLALIWPAPLTREANLLKLMGPMPVDGFIGFWLPIVDWSPALALVGAVLATVILSAAPWWCRPAQSQVQPTSTVDLERCTGCTQCAHDCPYEAITMEPREDGRRLVAVVSPTSCVSCGICSASCADLAIGPPGRSGLDQAQFIANELQGEWANVSAEDTIAFVCLHNGGVPAAWSRFAESRPDVRLAFVDCCGTVHTQTLETLLGRAGGVFLHACPERNCFNRDGLDLSTQRIWYKRVPFLDRKVDRTRLAIDASSDAELGTAMAKVDALRARIKSGDSYQPQQDDTRLSVGAALRCIFATALLLAAVGGISQLQYGSTPTTALLRIAARIPGKHIEHCRPLTEAEKASRPLHMQQPQLCESKPLPYRLAVSVDGKEQPAALNAVHPQADGTLLARYQTEISAGSHELMVLLSPVEETGGVLTYSFNETAQIGLGEILLLLPDRETGRFRASTPSP